MFYCIQAQYTKIQTKTKHGSVIVIVFFPLLPLLPLFWLEAGTWARSGLDSLAMAMARAMARDLSPVL
jgi:hypothetical protein